MMGIMKKVIILSFSLILVVFLSLTVCDSKSLAQAPDSKVYKLKFNFFGTRLAPPVGYYVDACDAIKQRTDDKVVITPFYSNTLLQFFNSYIQLGKGMANFSVYMIDVTAGAQSLNRIFNLPFNFDAPSCDKSSAIYGMPIIEADRAKHVFILKRSMASGFAKIPNPLFFKSNSTMIFGDAKKTLQSLIEQF